MFKECQDTFGGKGTGIGLKSYCFTFSRTFSTLWYTPSKIKYVCKEF